MPLYIEPELFSKNLRQVTPFIPRDAKIIANQSGFCTRFHFVCVILKEWQQDQGLNRGRMSISAEMFAGGLCSPLSRHFKRKMLYIRK
jgi:hypothetical protein